MSANKIHHLKNNEEGKDELPFQSQHQIYQTDEAIAVICNETPTNNSYHNNNLELLRSHFSENESSDDNEHYTCVNEYNANMKMSEKDLSINVDSTSTTTDSIKKNFVSYENDETVSKFISGEEIVDKKNPFRSAVADDNIIRSSLKTKINSMSATKRYTTDETDFITKEEILKQSKYVPVYIRNPDRVLTYDKSVLENLSNRPGNVLKRTPIPIPRKTIKEPMEKKKKRPQGKYPDLSEIKVKVGTDLDESLYDPNEVVLNAKKFDTLFKNLKFSSIDDIDKIAEITTEEESERSNLHSRSPEVIENDDKKSYTNTVHSKEFLEYLKKKGLVLFPTRPNGNNQSIKQSIYNNGTNSSDVKLRAKPVDVNLNERKKTVFRRLSSIFMKKKTAPKSSDANTETSLSFTGEKNEKNGSIIKRVILERTKFDNDSNRPILANNEFLTSKNFNESKFSALKTSEQTKPVRKPSIESHNVDAPNQTIAQKKPDNLSMYRNIDMKRSKLYQTLNDQKCVQENDKLPSFETLKLSNNVIKPKPYAHSIRKNASNMVNFKKEEPSLKTLELSSKLPLHKISENDVKPMDPFMYAKIHEIKRKTDEVLLNNSLNDKNEVKLSNQNFIRHSQQRSTFSNDSRSHYIHPNSRIRNQSLTPRSQSVLDNMICYDKSLYGEVTYRQPNSSQDVNVIMRRPSSSTLDKNQIREKVYEYYRKSVNSPVSFEKKDYQLKSPEFPLQSFNNYSNVQNRPLVPQKNSSRNSFRSLNNRSRMSESDSEFATETTFQSDRSRDYNTNREKSKSIKAFDYQSLCSPFEEQRIYDVVEHSPRPQRIPSTRHALIRPTLNRGDIIYNNQIYRPISAIVREVPVSPRGTLLRENRDNYTEFENRLKFSREPEFRGNNFEALLSNKYSGK